MSKGRPTRSAAGAGGICRMFAKRAVCVSVARRSFMAEALPGAYRKFGFVLAVVIFVVDQFAKWVITYPLQLGQRQTINLLPIFRLQWVENRGVSMGLLTASGEFGRWLL